MITPLKSETFNQAKGFYQGMIKSSRDMLEIVQKLPRNDLSKEVIGQEKEFIRYYYNELKKLYQWRAKLEK